ncbi:MAG: hypothetical protein P0116_16155 [Candidatus Nitrosocosmicus sp.]|nr:hypothetical protein [Candidatus Nitrosocosmicus sp.]
MSRLLAGNSDKSTSILDQDEEATPHITTMTKSIKITTLGSQTLHSNALLNLVIYRPGVWNRL